MILKEFLELRRDKRTMAMIIGLPLILLVIFGYAARFDVTDLKTDVYGPQAKTVAGQLKDPFDVKETSTSKGKDQAEQALREGTVDVAIVTGSSPSEPSTAYINGANLFAAQTAVASIATSEAPIKPDVLFNPDLETSWVMVPALVGMIMALIGTLITAIGLVKERQAGTLEQLAVMPFKPTDVIAGKIVPYFILGAFDLVLVTVLGCLLFGVPFNGNVLIFALGSALFLLAVLGLGVLISTVSQNQGQAMQVAMMSIMPQILLSGMIFPLESMTWGVRWIGYLLPLTWFNKIANGVMLRDAPLSSLWVPLLVLAAMAVLLLGAAVLRFRRDLAPAMPKIPAKTTATAGAGR
ncbi:ABC transporter permease [Actinocorallia longicatena]